MLLKLIKYKEDSPGCAEVERCLLHCALDVSAEWQHSAPRTPDHTGRCGETPLALRSASPVVFMFVCMHADVCGKGLGNINIMK